MHKLAQQDLEALLDTAELPESGKHRSIGEGGQAQGKEAGRVPRWVQDYPRRLLAALLYIEFNATEFVLPYSVLAY